MGVEVPSNPINRKEQYLAKIAGQAVEIPAEPITREEAYLDEIAKNGSGGGGGTTNYNLLSNKPQIAGTELQGNKSLADLGIASEEDLAGKQNALTAGLYIEFDGNEISVKRDITQTAQQIEYKYTIPSDYTLRVKKYVNSDLVDTTDYQWNSVTDPINLDSIMEVSKKAGGGFYWVVKNLIASTTQAANYSVELYAFQTSTNYTQTFITTIDADKKLIIQSELDTAINAIKDGQSIDSFADVETALAGKQGTLTFDDTPTDGSNNPVKSNGIYDALATKANTDMVAADFNAESSYTAGNYCVYNGKFYRFKNNHTGGWSASDVDEIKIAGELSSLKSGLTNIGTTLNGSHNADRISVDTDTAIDLGSVALTEGKWLLIAAIDWASNDTGYRQIAFSSGLNPARDKATITPAIADTGKETYQQVSRIYDVASTETVTVYGYQTSGAALNAMPYIRAIKISA